MSYVPTTASSAAASAEAARKARDEEENMTGYKSDDLDGWEFKIMRSSVGRFKNYDFIQQLCREEAKAGWEMVEKFDNYRIRFKRRIEKRAGDRLLDIDPYRTGVGFGSSKTLVLSLVFGVLLAGALAFILLVINK